MNVIFFGSSEYCIPILNTLSKHFNLTAVITKADKPVGRKQMLTPSPIKTEAEKKHIPVFTPPNRAELTGLLDTIKDLKPDIAVVADYGIIIPPEIFNIPKFKTLNIHFSRLPDLRGASPIQYTILRGDSSAWITYMLMDEGLDTGDILRQLEKPLKGAETAGNMYTSLFNIAADKLPEVITEYTQGKITPKPQDNTHATYTKILSRDDGYIPYEFFMAAINGTTAQPGNINELSRRFNGNLNKTSSIILDFLTIGHPPSTIIDRMLRAFTPWPGIWTEIGISNDESSINRKRLKILKAHLSSQLPVTSYQLPDKKQEEIIKKPATGNRQPATILIPDLVQLEGKNPVSWKQFQEAYHPVDSLD